MAKVDKTQFSKEQWKIIREQRRLKKQHQEIFKKIETAKIDTGVAFVIGNGISRKIIDIEKLSQYGKTYGCNALYREFNPNFLVAVDVKMVLEIAKAGYQKHNEVWTNPNKAYDKINKLNFFNPSKGWSSGPTALWLASEHKNLKIYILGFDFKGINEGKNFNNVYADTPNYKKSKDGATFFGNWLRQTITTIQKHQHISYIRLIDETTYNPPEFNNFPNYSTQDINFFKKIYST